MHRSWRARPANGISKETDVIETNEPLTKARESESTPEADLVQTAREVGTATQERLSDLKDAALSSLDEAKSAATEKVEETKEQAAGEIARTAQGLEAAAAEMEGSPLQQDLLREAAAGLKQIAHAVEGKSIGAMAGELSEFGRQNPVAYLGGAALVGFALARFARASTPEGTSTAFPSSHADTGSSDRSGARDLSGADLAPAEFGGSDHG
jgi:hypothetical protein